MEKFITHSTDRLIVISVVLLFLTTIFVFYLCNKKKTKKKPAERKRRSSSVSPVRTLGSIRSPPKQRGRSKTRSVPSFSVRTSRRSHHSSNTSTKDRKYYEKLNSSSDCNTLDKNDYDSVKILMQKKNASDMSLSCRSEGSNVYDKIEDLLEDIDVLLQKHPSIQVLPKK